MEKLIMKYEVRYSIHRVGSPLKDYLETGVCKDYSLVELVRFFEPFVESRTELIEGEWLN
jgi:hypothetical protein